ncbi:MAG: radical SAM protein [Gammaproteobacteria bacterium]
MGSEISSYLSVSDHSRDAAGLRYVYPVISRRAGGVSVGINLNTNNACNWRCVYCQVPDLIRGDAPDTDVALLREELAAFIKELQEGSFMQQRVPVEARRVVDVAISGNGEPTSSQEFAQVIAVIVAILGERKLKGVIPLRLITNGSRVMRAEVQEGLRRMAQCNGEAWFKVDAGTSAGMQRVNNVSLSPESVARNLGVCASLCPTWVQTCVFAMNERIPLADELPAYVELLRRAGLEKLCGVHLYGLARPSLQPEASMLRRLNDDELRRIVTPIRALGLEVRVSP